jgi:signal transduction histidine kinase/CheY-like chemotaxis protein
MSFLPIPESPSGLSLWLGRLGVHQDLVWFLVLLGWSAALILWRLNPTRATRWGWLPWAAVTGILTALVQFLAFNPPFSLFYERLVPGTNDLFSPAPIDPDWFADIVLALVFVGTTCVWGWRAARTSGRPALRWPVVLAGGGLIIVHALRPTLGGTLLALLPLAVVFFFWAKSRGHVGARAALICSALLPACSTIGPFASAVGLLQRQGPTGWFGALFALTELAAGGLALAVLVRESFATFGPGRRRALWLDARPYLAGGLLWLAAGLFFAIKSGRDEAAEVKTNRLRTTASRAAGFNPQLVAPLTDGRIVLNLPTATAVAGQPRAVPTLAGVSLLPLKATLFEIVQSTPFLQTARFVVLHEGWLCAVASSHPAIAWDKVILLRRATPQDYDNWNNQRDLIEEEPVPEAHRPYYCRAAVRSVDGHMLGWLEFVREEFYSSMERKWRTGPLLVTALGAILGAAFFVQRRSNRERETARREAAVAIEADRVKTAFLAKVSHELRTPLQSILGYNELLLRDTTDAGTRTQLQAIRQHGELMTRLVNDLIDLSALESGAFRLVEKPTQLTALVQQTVESLRPRAAARGLTLDFFPGPDAPGWVETDAERVRQIVLNLVGNAVKFTETGGVQVILRSLAGGFVELAVIDTGPGIAPGEQARLFQPFSRLELTADKEGTGLGLALVAGLCRSLGGHAGVESQPGQGSRFFAHWRARPAAAPASRAPTGNLLLSGWRVLIADDNALVRDLFSSYLGELGAHCTTVVDGEEAVRQAQRQTFDAFVLDLAMPRCDGLEATRRLRAAGFTARILGVSAHADPADRERALTAGMDAFLTKPVELAALAGALTPQPAPTPAGAAQLYARLAAQFRTEAAAQAGAMATALDRRDWPTLQTRSHYMTNSAAVVRDDRLFTACAALEAAAVAADATTAAAAWTSCRVALQPWVETRVGL